MRAVLSQLNPVVGDLDGNRGKLREVLESNSEADLIVFPELFLTGYPPQDLLLKKGFLCKVEESVHQVQELSQAYPKLTIVLGTPWLENGTLFNSALVIQAGRILGLQHKRNVSKFRGFDETYYFNPGQSNTLIQIGEKVVGLALGLELDQKLALALKEAGADLVINPVAIPFQVGEYHLETQRLAKLAEELNLPILRVGQVGGNDGLIFAGGSMSLDQEGKIQAQAADFCSSVTLVDLALPGEGTVAQAVDETAQVYEALVLGLRDYIHKSGMSKVIIGLSGGLDSAVSAALATAAVGPENIWGISQPGPFSSPGSVDDARALAENLGIRFSILPITTLYDATLMALDEQFSGTAMNVAEENIQARLRGNLLMALSNKFGGLVLTNGNKSELAVGYCTLYGDMSGGFAPIADIYKTMVYQVAYYMNREREIIPWNTIEKPPSAELRPDQRDDQSLPPYDILDGIIRSHLDAGLSMDEIVAQGYAKETVDWVIKTIDSNDYKRKQAALILRITSPIHGQDRQMPFAARKHY